MSLYGIMRTSTSGMAAQADRMSVMADNIANVNTTGYKRGSAEFSTLFPQEGALAYQSGGVETHVRQSVSEQGGFTTTHSTTDLAINGDGFFVVRGARDEIALTRAGSFVPDQSGNLKNAAGFALLGYDLSQTTGSTTVINGTAGLVPVNVSSLSLRATASTSGALNANLPAAATNVPASSLPSANVASASYTSKTSLVGYDNLGAETTLDMFCTKTGANTWEIAVYNRADAPSSGTFPYASSALATTTLTFDASNGALASGSPKDITIPVPNGQSVTLDLSKMTQLAGEFSVQSASIDGNAPVAVEKIEISEGGILTALYNNGARIPSFRIPVGRVPSADHMTTLNGNVYLPDLESGDLLISDAASGGAGLVLSSTLEQSTVDLASELTTMIEAQRSYTANSKVFQTGSELMDVIVNLRR